MSIKYNNILNPIKTLEQIKEQLFALYIEDYGENSLEEMRKRWDNTVFITDVTPKEALDFYKQIKGKKVPPMLYIEYLDYLKTERLVDKAAQLEFMDYFRSKYNIYSQEQLQELWNIKKGPTKREYSYEVLRSAHNMLNSLEEIKRKRLIDRTLWGRRLKKKYPTLLDEQLMEIVFQNIYPAVTCVIKNKENKYQTICYVPLIRHREIPSLDRMLLHELRHVVETDKERSGFVEFPNLKYNAFNEIRTERNAIRDEKRIKIIFARTSNSMQSPYEVLIPRLNKVEQYDDIINRIAFYGWQEEDEDIMEHINHLAITDNNDGKKMRKRVK